MRMMMMMFLTKTLACISVYCSPTLQAAVVVVSTGLGWATIATIISTLKNPFSKMENGMASK